MVATIAFAASMTHDAFGSRLQKIANSYDKLPFESVTRDQVAISQLKAYLDARNENILESRRLPQYLIVVLPRHAAASKNIFKIVEWRVLEGQKVQSRKAVVVDEAKFVEGEVDQDGNTYLNRLLLSHPFLFEQDAILVYDLLAKRGKLNPKPNRFGQTPLMLATEAGWPGMFDRILKLKAPLNSKDIEGRDAIDYLAFTKPEVKIGEVAQRVVFTVELVADALYNRSKEVDKKRIFKIMNHWLENPYRLDCGTIANPENYFDMQWPTPRGKKPKEKPAAFIFDRKDGLVPSIGVPPKLGSKG